MRDRYALLVLLAAITSCGRSARCSADPCGTAVIVATAEPDVLFPPLVQSGPGFALTDQIFLKLADIGPALNTGGDAGFVPRLARSWKFETPKTIVFDLDPRAKWQDGAPVTAADVTFTFDIYRDTLVASPVRPLLERIASVTARDDHTVVFEFKSEYAEQFYDATHQMRILPRHLLESIPRKELGSNAFARNPVGDGPYRIVSWKAGESIELAANPGFFQGTPGLGRIVWTVAPDFGALITRLVAGEADMTEFVGGPDNIARVEATKNFQLVKYPSATYAYLSFNLRNPSNLKQPHPLLGDRELRRALLQGVDRNTLVHAILGDYGQVPVGPTSRSTARGNDSTVSQLPFDSMGAQASLDKLGWKTGADGIRARNGRKLEFEIVVPISSQIRRRAAVILQDQFKRLGVSVKLRELEFNLFRNAMSTGKYDAALDAWGEDPSPSAIQQIFTSAGIGKSNFGGYANPKFDNLVHEAVYSTDPAVARTRWREAYTVINDDVPGIWLFAPVQAAAVHGRYENVTIRPDEWAATMWTWKVAPDKLIGRDLDQPGAARGNK